MNLWTVGCADPRLTAQARSPMGQAGENAMPFPRLAHRSAAAHKLHSTPQQEAINSDFGEMVKPAAGYRPLAYASPEAVQTTGTVAVVPLPPLAEQCRIVAKVNELMALCDQLEASLTTGDDTRGRLLEALIAEALVPGVEVMPTEAARVAVYG